MHRIILVFFFLSGFTSLVFEVLWERMLMQVFGSTTFAISTLLTSFMAGLAIGSALGGRVAARLERPLLTYAMLEAGVGLYALCVPALLSLLPDLYGLFFDQYLDNFYLFSLLRFAVVFVILLVPTTLMGATLPIVSQWISRHERAFQGSIGLLYGANTLGACLGTLSAGFGLLPWLGLSLTNGVFALTNFALCALVLVARRTVLSPARLARRAGEEAERGEALRDLGVEVEVAVVSPGLARLAAGCFALFGALSMSYQVLWTRGYVIVLGSSTYSFTLILVSFLVGLSVGSALTSVWSHRFTRPLYWLAISQLGLAASATLTFFVIDRLPELLFYRLREAVSSANEIYAYNFLLVGAVVLIPTMLQGMSFPLIVRALVSDREEAGARVGRLYALNTLGSIVGSFTAGFILLPWLGLSASIAVVVACGLLGASALGLGELWSQRTAATNLPTDRWRMMVLMSSGLGAALIFGLAPPIDRVRLTRGLFRAYWARELFDAKKLARDRPELLFYKDGVNVTTSVERRGKYVTLKGNGKAEASDGADMATQILVGLTPFIFQSAREWAEPGREVGVMVGYGSGVTAGASLQWPLARLEVIELEEAMIEASRFFDHVNHKPLDDTRHALILSDGRNYLEYNTARYDVIVSEPSNPWIAGVASLFTVEHFERARRRLRPGGIFGQWVQLYELSPQNVRVIVATFMQAFPHVQAFSSMPKGTDLILIGSDEPIPMPADGFERAMQIESVRAELKRAGLEDMYDFYGLMFMSQSELEVFAAGAPLNTDDNGYLEFSAPRDLVRYDVGQAFFTEQYHAREDYGDPRPALESWGDASVWTGERVGRLARGLWRAGKASLAYEVMTGAGYAGGDVAALPDGLSAPFDALEEMFLVRHAARLDASAAMIELWPGAPDDALARLMVEAAAHGKGTQAMHYMESQERPEPNGYSGLKGLLYAYVLSERGYWRFALRQVERLREEGEAQLVESALFDLVRGRVYVKRLRYTQGYQAYLRAGARLLAASYEELEEVPAASLAADELEGD